MIRTVLGLAPHFAPSFNTTRWGRLIRETTQEGTVVKSDTEYQYDARGRQTAEIHHDEIINQQQATWTLSSLEGAAGVVNGRDDTQATLSNPAALFTATAASQSNSDGMTERITRDANNNVSLSEHVLNGLVEFTTKFEYDADGLLRRLVEPPVNGESAGGRK